MTLLLLLLAVCGHLFYRQRLPFGVLAFWFRTQVALSSQVDRASPVLVLILLRLAIRALPHHLGMLSWCVLLQRSGRWNVLLKRIPLNLRREESARGMHCSLIIRSRKTWSHFAK